MARQNAIHSGMAYYSLNAGPFSNFFGAINRGDYNRENISVGTRFGTAATYASTFSYGLTNGTVVLVTDTFFCTRFRLRRVPLAQSQIMQWGMNTVANAMHLDVTTGGLLSFYNAAGTGNLIASSAAITTGDTQAAWVTVQGRIRVSAGATNQAMLTLIVNGTTIFDTASVPGLVPGAAAGLNAIGSLNNVLFQVPAPTANAVELDFDQYIADSTDLPTPTRWTYLRPTGAGNYSTWLGGTTDFRDRLVTRSISAAPLSTALLSSRQSYTIPTPASKGITGTIKSINISGYTGACPIATITYFFRKGGVDTDCGATNPVSGTETVHRATFTSPGWATTDTLEIGFMSGSVAGTYRHQFIGVWVEHDTPFNAPVDEPVVIERGNYTGNGTFQTIATPFTADFILISARAGTGAMAFWTQGMDAFCTINAVGVNIGAWTDGTRIELNGNVANFNTGAAVYDVLYVSDPENRIFGDGSYIQQSLTVPVDTQNYQVRTPTITSPEGLIMQQFLVGSAAANITTFYNPGMGTNLAKNFGSVALAADIINQIIATGFEARKAFFASVSSCQYPFLALKPTGSSTVVLTAIVQYIGDGTASLVVPLPTLGSQVPFWAWIFPHNNTAAYSKNDQQTNTFPMIGGAGTPVGITAFGAGSLTVGTTLNTNGVVYTVFALVEGTDLAAGNQYSGIYFIDPTARHDTLWDRLSGPATTVNQKIPNPTYRTHFIGDS